MVAITKCDDHTVSSIQTRLSHIYKDFYVKDHWHRLPLSWQQYLGQQQFSHLAHLLTGRPWCQSANGSVSPLSLLALKAVCDHYCLKRQCVDLDSPHVVASASHTLQGRHDAGELSHHAEAEDLTSASVRAVAGRTLGFKNGQLMEMEHIFRKHVKPKKQHEIRQLGKVIQLVAQLSGSQHVVDVGAGLGHLSRLLTFAHGLKVTTVEATGGHAPKASEFDRELKKDIQKKLQKRDGASQQTGTTLTAHGDLPSHVVCTVQPDITTEDFLSLVLNTDCGTGLSTDTTLSSGTGDRRDMAPDMERERRMLLECETSLPASNKPGVVDLGQKEQACVSFVREQSAPVLSNTGQIAVEPRVEDSKPEICGHSGESAAKISRYEREGKSEPNFIQGKTVSANSESSVMCDSALCTHERQAKPCLCSGDTDSTGWSGSEHNSTGRHLILQQDLGQCDQVSEKTVCVLSAKSHFGTGTISECSSLDRNVSDDPNEGSSELSDRDKLVTTQTPSASQKVGCEDVQEDKDKGRSEGLVLAGLHACGDLTATLLRVFLNCPAVTALVSVGCCYMKLSAYSPDEGTQLERGYPMSQFVQRLAEHPLTYEAREMACHFADAYAQRLLEGPPHLKIHSYRAALQYVITQTCPHFVNGATRLVVKKGAEILFPQYASQCLRRLGMDVSQVSDEVMATAESLTSDWRHVVAFYTLRLSLAPLVETALLLDRMLFLHEQGVPSVLLPVFDSTLSPRNFALLACKPASPH